MDWVRHPEGAAGGPGTPGRKAYGRTLEVADPGRAGGTPKKAQEKIGKNRGFVLNSLQAETWTLQN